MSDIKLSKKKKVLIIDNDQVISRVLGLKLVRLGIEVTKVTSGEKGLELLIDNNFDLLVMEIVLSHLNGYDILERMAKNLNRTPVIIYTNLCQEDDIKRAKTLGVTNFYQKTEISVYEVVNSIKKIFNL
jgi:DNA-binding response OmpR family regulator